MREQAVAAGAHPQPVPAVGPAESGWATPEFCARVAIDLGHGRFAMSWAVEGLHCPACTWVLERLPFIDSGIEHATVDLGRGVLRTVHRAASTDLQRIATLAATLGYRLRPWAGAGEDERRRSVARGLALRAAVALACAVGAMQLAMNLAAGELTGDLAPQLRQMFALGALLPALPAATWAVGPWWTALARAVRFGRWSLDATAAVVVVVGLGASVWGLVQGTLVTYADAVAMFCALLLAGRAILHRVQDQLAVQASRLGGLLPEQPPEVGSELTYGEGQRLGGDGVAVAVTACELDVAILTGESRPQSVNAGSTVYAGSLVVSGACTVRIATAGSATRLGGLLAAAEATPRGSAQVAGWERWYGILLLAAGAIAAGWSLDRGVAVIMAACPCAIGLALPLARARVLGAARARGVLMRDAEALVRMRHITRVVFDKTGTLTTGRLTVVRWEWSIPAEERRLLAGAIVAAERQARHPVGLAIERHLGAVPLLTVADVSERPRTGLHCRWEGQDLTIGPGTTGLQVQLAGRTVATFQVVDGLRPDAADVVTAFAARGWSLAIASGDQAAPVAAVATTLGISDARSQLLPEDKASMVDASTLMIGDGVNDAAALTAAGVSVAVRGGVATGLSCADIVVTDEAAPLQAVRAVVDASEALRRRERLLLLATVVYNLVAVSAALTGLWGPLICAIGMPLSSIAAVVLATTWQPFGAQQRHD